MSRSTTKTVCVAISLPPQAQNWIPVCELASSVAGPPALPPASAVARAACCTKLKPIPDVEYCAMPVAPAMQAACGPVPVTRVPPSASADASAAEPSATVASTGAASATMAASLAGTPASAGMPGGSAEKANGLGAIVPEFVAKFVHEPTVPHPAGVNGGEKLTLVPAPELPLSTSVIPAALAVHGEAKTPPASP